LRYASMHSGQAFGHDPTGLGFAWGALIGLATSALGASKQRKARKRAAAAEAAALAEEQRRMELVKVRSTYPPTWINPVLIVGGVVVAGTLVYFVMRRPRRRRR